MARNNDFSNRFQTFSTPRLQAILEIFYISHWNIIKTFPIGFVLKILYFWRMIMHANCGPHIYVNVDKFDMSHFNMRRSIVHNPARARGNVLRTQSGYVWMFESHQQSWIIFHPPSYFRCRGGLLLVVHIYLYYYRKVYGIIISAIPNSEQEWSNLRLHALQSTRMWFRGHWILLSWSHRMLWKDFHGHFTKAAWCYYLGQLLYQPHPSISMRNISPPLL